MREASVGFQCLDCLGESRRQTVTARRGQTIAGAIQSDRPLVVPALIVLNVVIFGWTVLEAGSLTANADSPLFAEWSMLPRFVATGEWWRLFTSGFLHFGPLHLAFNMLALWIIGRDLELVLGRLRFLAVYLMGLLGGSAAVFALGGVSSQVAGASGAVFGLMGGLAVVLRKLRRPPGPALTLIAVNIAISFILPSISILGHLGGLVAGAIATAVMVYAPARNRTAWQTASIAGLTLLLLLVMAMRAAALA